MKIIFIVNAIENQRCVKRIEEFMDNGYNVDVYTFSRRIAINNSNIRFSYEIIGEIENGSSYFGRLPLMKKAIKAIIDKYKNQGVVYYIFGLDLALVFSFLNKKQSYIYEESDLAHTYISNAIVRKSLELIDRRIIRNSLGTVLTSEGFAKYHFGSYCPNNVHIITNRLNSKILSIKPVSKPETDLSKIKIGFVGKPRFESVLSFAKIFCRHYPQHEFHVYGGPITNEFQQLSEFKNCILHGSFKNPDDLPEIYSNLDLVLSTYDVRFDNVRYAEPNKIYEAIYFETPIIVSKGTFLSDKVTRLGIGYDIDPLNEIEIEICQFIDSLTVKSLEYKKRCAAAIPKSEAINDNGDFFAWLKLRIANS